MTKDSPSKWPAVIDEMMEYFRGLDSTWFYLSSANTIMTDFDFLELRTVVNKRTGKIIKLSKKAFRIVNDRAMRARFNPIVTYSIDEGNDTDADNVNDSTSMRADAQVGAQYESGELLHAADDGLDT